MMGRGSDTRMYAPRSESDTMYSSANEGETKYNPTSPQDKDERNEKKKLRAEEKKERRDKIKHLKVRASQGIKGEESSVAEDDGNKQDDEREIGLQGGPAGSRGNLLDLATGAKSGTGSAMTGPLPIAMSEPMDGAWSELLKGQEVSDFIQQYPNIKFQEQTLWDDDIANETDDYGTSTLGSTSYTDPQFDTARSRRMNPQTMDILQRFVDRSKAKPKIIQQVHGNVENPYYVPFDMKNPPLETASSNPRFDNQYYYDTAAEKQSDYDEYYSPKQMRDFNRRFNIQTGKPMDGAWSSLLKASIEELIQERNRLQESGLSREAKQFDRVIQQMMRPDRQEQHILESLGIPSAKLIMPELDNQSLRDIGQDMMHEGKQNPDYIEMQRRMDDYDPQVRQQFMNNISSMARRMPKIDSNRQEAEESLRNLQATDPTKFFADQEIATGEPMSDAWSSLLKRDTPNKIQSRRRREKRREFRPSTGQFKRPPGGMSGGAGSTMRRFRAHMRGIKGGKKTGLMKPHLSVEMSHRGIATKQPMSKDPQKYRQYMGQSEARKILGNVRSSYSPHARYGERSVTAGPTGAGRIGGLLAGQSGQMNRPSLRQIGIRRPRIRKPRNPVQAMQAPMGVPSQPMQAPSSISSLPQPSAPMMMSEERAESELLKGRKNSLTYHKINLLRRLIRAQERAEKLGKSMQGTRSAMENGHIPSHPAGVHQHEDEDEKNDGPTQNLETNSSRLGLDPAGYITSKRGHMG